MPASALQYEKIGNMTESEKIMHKFYVQSFRRGYVRANGFILPEDFQKFGERIQRMDVRDDDIFVCSFPRTGTTWVSEMVWSIANNLDFEGAKSSVHKRVSFLEFSSLYTFNDDLAPDSSLPNIDSVKHVENLKSPRFIKSHLAFGLLPEKLRNFSTGAKIVYVWRDPKDTCVSCYHFHRTTTSYTGDFNAFCQLFLDDLVNYGPFWKHVLGYLALKNNPNVLLLKYEEMKQDLQSAIRKTASFLGKALTEEQIARLQNHLSFENMQKNPAVNRPDKATLFKSVNTPNKDGSFIRSGTVGGWMSVMSPEVSDKFDDWTSKCLEGSDFQLTS